MRVLFIVPFLLCLSLQVASAQKLQLLGAKAALAINSNIDLAGAGNPFFDVGATAYIQLGKRLGFMPEVSLKNATYERGFWSYDKTNITDLYLKTNVVYGIIQKEAEPMPRLFVSLGYSISRIMYIYGDAYPIDPEKKGRGVLLSQVFRTQHKPYLGIGYSKKISRNAWIVLHPEILPLYGLYFLGANPRFPWEAHLNVSCLWEIR